MNEIFERIEYLKNKIVNSKDSDTRIMMISDYMTLINLLRATRQIDEEDWKEYCCEFDTNSYQEFLKKRILEYGNELIINNQNLIRVFYELKDIYLDIDWENEPEMPDDAVSLLTENFLEVLSKDALKLYNKMKFNKIISIVSDDETIGYGGWCYGQKTGKCSYIFSKSPDKITETDTIIHELGHAYNYYLVRNQLTGMYYSITSEVMSFLFEKAYFRYLEDNGFNTDHLWYDYYLSLYYPLMNSYLICNLIKNKKIKLHSYDLIGDSSYSDKKLIKFAERFDYYIDKVPTLNLYDFSYIVSDVISDYFLKLMEEDYQMGFKEACKFMQEADCYRMSEILDKYASDLSYTKNSIRRIIENGKSYQKRK